MNHQKTKAHRSQVAARQYDTIPAVLPYTQEDLDGVLTRVQATYPDALRGNTLSGLREVGGRVFPLSGFSTQSTFKARLAREVGLLDPQLNIVGDSEEEMAPDPILRALLAEVGITPSATCRCNVEPQITRDGHEVLVGQIHHASCPLHQFLRARLEGLGRRLAEPPPAPPAPSSYDVHLDPTDPRAPVRKVYVEYADLSAEEQASLSKCGGFEVKIGGSAETQLWCRVPKEAGER